LQGHLSLIRAAEIARIRQIVFVSIHDLPIEFPLQDAKRGVEARLRVSPISYTVLQPTYFRELWLGPAFWPAVGVDFRRRRARIPGCGKNAINWISIADVADIAVASLGHPAAQRSVLELGGPDSLGYIDAVRILEEHTTGGSFDLEFVPEATLRSRYAEASDPYEKSFSGLLLACALGHRTRDAAFDEALVPRSTVRDYALQTTYDNT
jgi:hypothetical protein